jgi:hypothetical protein
MGSSLAFLAGSPLAAHVWRGDALAHEAAALPTGYPELDLRLPGGGWPPGALTEILLACEGIGELRLALPALARLTADGRLVVLVDPPYLPYAPALAVAGIELHRLLIVRASTQPDRLWAFEQALRAGECGAVFAWLPVAEERTLRRLQIAAREGSSWGVLWRRPGQRATTPTAALRLRLAPHEHALEVEILKRRGGPLARPFTLRVDDALAGPALPGASGRDLHPRLAHG